MHEMGEAKYETRVSSKQTRPACLSGSTKRTTDAGTGLSLASVIARIVARRIGWLKTSVLQDDAFSRRYICSVAEEEAKWRLIQ
jgi:hypothetical protein